MSKSTLPHFTGIEVESFPTQLDSLLNGHLNKINSLLENSSFNWDNLMRPLEEMEDELEQFWSPFSHLHSVVDSPSLRKAFEACLPKLTAYQTAIGQNQALYNAVKSLDINTLNPIQNKIVTDSLRNFKLAGVALSPEKKKRFEEIQTKLSSLSHTYETNVLDATQAFFLHVTNENRLKGIPNYVMDNAATIAKEKNEQGWMFNLEFPTYYALITYAEDRSLRQEIHKAYTTRASDQGPHAGKFDNSSVMNEILSLRHEEAQLLDFANYAELSLAAKMADSPAQVLDFLNDLSSRALQQAKQEYTELVNFAQKEFKMDKVEPWDMAYLSEKKKQKVFAISDEELRPYFPLHKVMDGLFTIINKLYGMRVEEVKDVDTWHPDVTCYQLFDSENNLRGYLYADLFARTHKRGGAWMDSLRTRFKQTENNIQLPIATLSCNFAKPASNKLPTLSHEEVQTLFHECGHCLHHVLSKVDYHSASGINGVEWDAVELPSQFFENWCWDEEALRELTSHIDTNEPLPPEMFDKLLAAKNFQSALAMMRQLELSLFDFRMHKEYKPEQSEFIATILADVRKKTSVTPIAPYNRFQHSFTHIFGGGYAAGYYSYKWAEVLSSDAFSRFEEEGIFNPKTGKDFLQQVLEVGSSRKAADNFLAFRGRVPTVDALLRHNGIEG